MTIIKRWQVEDTVPIKKKELQQSAYHDIHYGEHHENDYATEKEDNGPPLIIILSSVFGTVLIFLLLGFALWRRRKKKRSSSPIHHDHRDSAMDDTPSSMVVECVEQPPEKKQQSGGQQDDQHKVENRAWISDHPSSTTFLFNSPAQTSSSSPFPSSTPSSPYDSNLNLSMISPTQVIDHLGESSDIVSFEYPSWNRNSRFQEFF
ncbi:uncharacterized protein BX664DRAFT_93567 [Halteromyces radiatus]|uniref:uncharacterized protein n=1 Tax=Halteromyces radiatus TaxID=101107 RepID=UPI00221FAB8F|nr:uncharacterized protein BX664DRAFT_93567 [Halteromyces radiatus]KAI8092736.1 hypothetical protein BX664DRAFT_93567 [Halteromyces radiatus]